MIEDYPTASVGQYAGEANQMMVRKPTLKERLDMAVKDAEQRLAEAKEARAIFERNPDLERLLDIMQKGRF